MGAAARLGEKVIMTFSVFFLFRFYFIQLKIAVLDCESKGKVN